MYGILEISTSALIAQRANMDIIAGNIANKDVTRDADGKPNPYRRLVPLFASGRKVGSKTAPGVRIDKIIADPSPFHLRFDPSHPDAIKEGPKTGFVRMPNVNNHVEMVNLLVAQRAYEANVTVIETTKAMASSTLQLLA